MTTYAIGQQSFAVPPNQAYPGDYYGVPGVPGTSTAETGFIASGDVAVGTFAWVINATPNLVTKLKGITNTRAVFIPRSNDNTYSNADLAQGWSFTVPANYQLKGAANGSFYVAVTTPNAGGTVLVGDTVYIKEVDGDVVVATASPGAGYYDTGYKVAVPSVPNSFGILMVVITNVGAI
jgi:hypothetical protein